MNERYVAVLRAADLPNSAICHTWRSYFPRFCKTNGRIPDTPRRRFLAVWTAKRPRSAAIQRRPSRSAATAVVPEPATQSRTRSPSLLDASMIRWMGLPSERGGFGYAAWAVTVAAAS